MRSRWETCINRVLGVVDVQDIGADLNRHKFFTGRGAAYGGLMEELHAVALAVGISLVGVVEMGGWDELVGVKRFPGV